MPAGSQGTQGRANGLTNSHGAVGEPGAVEDLLLIQLAQHLGLAQVRSEAAGVDALHDLAAVTLQHIPEYLLIQRRQRGIHAAQLCHARTVEGAAGRIQDWASKVREFFVSVLLAPHHCRETVSNLDTEEQPASTLGHSLLLTSSDRQ